MLTVSLYTLQVFDRVFASHSYDTLIYLTFFAGFAVAILSVLDYIRSRILLFISHWLDNKTSPEALNRSVDILLQGQSYPQQSLKDIAEIRNFLSGFGILSMMDAPWTPVYIFVIFLLHPLLGFISVLAVVVLFLFAYFNEKAIRKMSSDMGANIIREQNQIASTLRNAETIQAMGMLPNVIKRWFKENEQVLSQQDKINKRSGAFVAYSKFCRLFFSIAIIGVGGALVVDNQLTSGAMIAASIIMSRALAPIEQIISLWNQMIKARQAYLRLDSYFSIPKPRQGETNLPRPEGYLVLDNATLIAPMGRNYILKGISFEIRPGDLLVIIGPSAAGKTSLARLLVGVWATYSGTVRLDGSEVYTWERSDLGQYIGYLPQSVELFNATVKENIARLKPDANDADIIQAAKDAFSHDIILRLPQGYDTVIAEASQNLSGGQKQRIALARAFYGNPQFIVLDEPSSNLDIEGLNALMNAINQAKKNKKTLVIVTHDSNLIKLANFILYLREGQTWLLGPADQVLAKLAALQKQAQEQAQGQVQAQTQEESQKQTQEKLKKESQKQTQEKIQEQSDDNPNQTNK